MKTRRLLMVLSVLVLALLCYGCGSGSSSSDGNDDGNGSTSGMSKSEATAFAEQISRAGARSTGNVSTSMSKGLVDKVQCSQDGKTCTFNESYTYTTNCTAGGNIQVLTSLTGSISNGSGLLQIGATETITDWKCITGYIINGDPYISLTGTFSFMNYAPATQQSMSIGGGFKWGTTADESCQIDLSILFNASTG